jgi:voltage-gated potassium channel
MDAEVILSLREISDIEIIELVNNLDSSRFLRYAGASKIISPKTLLGTFIAQIASPPKKNLFPGATRLFGELMLVELPIYPGCELTKECLSIDSIKKSGTDIVGMWQKGVFLPDPGPEIAIQSNSVLLAVPRDSRIDRYIRTIAKGVGIQDE